MTGHTLDVAWLCFGCGHRIPAGETVHPHGETWRCAACLPAPAPAPAPAPRRKPQPEPYNLTGLPGPTRQTTRRTRYAKGTTLEELLAE